MRDNKDFSTHEKHSTSEKTVKLMRNRVVSKNKNYQQQGDVCEVLNKETNCHHEHWHLLDINEVPMWLQFNRYILSGYRKPGISLYTCFQSLFKIHNETGNVWTHLLSCIIFMVWCYYTLFVYLADESIEHRIIFLVFLLSAMFCFFSSTGYHLFSPHCESTMICVARLDYSGISGLCVGSVVPAIFYAFYCYPFWQVIYLGIIGLLGLAGIVGSFFSFFHTESFQTIRITLFAFTAGFGIIPTLHSQFLPQLTHLGEEFVDFMERASIEYNPGSVQLNIYLMYFFYVLGFVLYVSQFPERYFPGKFDYWFNSHQFWHIFVFAATAVHYFNIQNIFRLWNLHKEECPALFNAYYQTTDALQLKNSFSLAL